MKTASVQMTATELGGDADYWRAAANGKPKRGWLNRLPKKVTEAFADIGQPHQLRITPADDGVTFYAVALK